MNNQVRINYITIGPQPSFEPNEAQVKRAAARRRFNRLYIYTPILLLTAVGLFLTGMMVWSLFTPAAAQNAAFLSGLANIILILVLLPAVIVWGAIVALPITLYIKHYQGRRKPAPADQVYVRRYGRFRLLLWQIDHKLDQLQQLLFERILPALVNPIIRAHRFSAFLKAWLREWYAALT
jgi:hypothetical protein